MKIKLGELRAVVGQVIREATLFTRGEGEMVQWSGDRDRIVKALAKMGIGQAERSAIIDGKIPLNGSIASTLQKKGILSRVAKPRPEPAGSKRSSWDRYSDRLDRDRRKLEKAYHAAVKEFVKPYRSFQQESPDISPEDAAFDLADNFFHEYPEWPEWARALDMRRSDMKAGIVDYVYDAMMKGKG